MHVNLPGSWMPTYHVDIYWLQSSYKVIFINNVKKLAVLSYLTNRDTSMINLSCNNSNNV